MNSKIHPRQFAKLVLIWIFWAGFACAQSSDLAKVPPQFRQEFGAPMTMINLSRDHQLFYKAYNDYTDLDPSKKDGIETTYKNSFAYYGYFDNQKCYAYSATAQRFEPSGPMTNDRYCADNKWSGNFLNWASMTRMDVVRKILYGGYRSTDSATETVLERTHLPTDAHSFVKYYKGSDIGKLTPFNVNEISLCNTTLGTNTANSSDANRYSQTNANPPLLRVARGNFSLWAANEQWQCYWADINLDFDNNSTSWAPKDTYNGNDSFISGIFASGKNPYSMNWVDADNLKRDADGLRDGAAGPDYVVRVKVCDSFKLGSEGCKQYPSGNYKPIGILQNFGDSGLNEFGLLTGSYQNNLSGGVLRRNVGDFSQEVNVTSDGTFKSNVTGIIKNIDKLRVYGYDYSGWGYAKADGENCGYQEVGISQGRCSSWGNPISEMYLESLRYFAGKSPTPAFIYDSGSKDATLGLTTENWIDPFRDDANRDRFYGKRVCRPINMLTFTANIPSYDGENMQGFSDITTSGGTPASLTNALGTSEGISNTRRFVGQSNVNDSSTFDGFCTSKLVANLADVRGLCPEAPAYQGSYLIAGMAKYAHVNPIRTDITIPANNTRAFRVNSYGVALATGVPRIEIPVPKQTGKTITIQPAFLFNGVKTSNWEPVYTSQTTCNRQGRNCTTTQVQIGWREVITVTPKTPPGSGQLVDFKIVSQSVDPATNEAIGKFLVTWEVSAAGGNYDQDVWGTIGYRIYNNGTQIDVTTAAYFQSTSASSAGFGYIISGTTRDGAHFHSGINQFTFSDLNPPTSVSIVESDGSTPTSSNFAQLNSSNSCNACNAVLEDTSARPTKATYTIGNSSNAGTALKDPLYYMAKYGSFTDANGNNIPDDVKEWAPKNSQSNPTDPNPDGYIYAIDPAELDQKLSAFLGRVFTSGITAPAISSSNFDVGDKSYSTQYFSDYSGNVLAYAIGDKALVNSTPLWEGAKKINEQDFSTGRVIVTMDDNGVGQPFRWTNLSQTQQDLLNLNPRTGTRDAELAGKGQLRLNYLRGDQSNEDELLNTGLYFRPRKQSRLGSIINSNPWYSGQPAAGYSNSLYAGYNDFRQNNLGRAPVLFVGANDGMLHGFDAQTGKVVLSYVPRALYPKLTKLTDKDYLEVPYVDGSPVAADLDVGANSSGNYTPNWRTYLIGSLGRGGQGLFALDVTLTNSTALSEARASEIVKWEFTDADDVDLGNIVTPSMINESNSQPRQVASMANGQWAMIVGNGYKSEIADGNVGTGRAALFILFAKGPSGSSAGKKTWVRGVDYIKIPVGSAGNGPNNGLGTPFPVDTNRDGKVDRIYAGDLKGNVWRFDVSSSNPADWHVEFNGDPFYTAQITSGLPNTPATPLPITAGVIATAHPLGGYMVNFGTGKALANDDLPSAVQQTMFGIWDRPNATTPPAAGRARLLQQIATATSDGRGFFTGDAAISNWSEKDGWYFNFPLSGELLVSNPSYDNSISLIFKTIYPNSSRSATDGCSTNYDGVLYMLNSLDGSRFSKTFDVNGDQVFDDADLSVNADSNKQALSGLIIPGGISDIARAGQAIVLNRVPTTITNSLPSTGSSNPSSNPSATTNQSTSSTGVTNTSSGGSDSNGDNNGGNNGGNNNNRCASGTQGGTSGCSWWQPGTQGRVFWRDITHN